ncbi:MAG: hypothetical protein H0X38_06685 [Planctomycetes bacterium]|nr:hypothetical protein [Planctomycetota bacterium]
MNAGENSVIGRPPETDSVDQLEAQPAPRKSHPIVLFVMACLGIVVGVILACVVGVIAGIIPLDLVC